MTATCLIRVRATTLDQAVVLVEQFLRSASHGHGDGGLVAIVSPPARRTDRREARAVARNGSAWLRRMRTEMELLAAAKRIRLETQLAPYRSGLSARAYRELEREYLERISFGRERAFLRRIAAALPPLELTPALRRELYELAVAHRQHTTSRTFPFADGSAHLESCRVFDLRGTGRRFYALCELSAHAH